MYKNTLISNVRYLILLGFFIYSSTIQGQEKYPYSIQVTGSQGLLLSHHPSIGELIKKMPVLYNVSIGKNTFGEKNWQRMHQFPSYGLHLGWVNYQNPSVLGYSFHSVPYIKFAGFRSKKYALHISTGWGLGYITKIFDSVYNFKNNLTGSHLNAVGIATIENQVRVSDRLHIGFDFVFFHTSNGSIKKPNQGMNMPMFGLSVKYAFGKEQMIASIDSISKEAERSKKWNIGVQSTWGVKETFPIGTKKYINGSLSAFAERNFGQKSIFMSGIDVFYTPSLVQDLEVRGITTNPSNAYRVGVPLYYGFDVDRLKLWISWGIYVLDKHKIDGLFYHRAGVSYRMYQNLHIVANLKSHYAKADYFEIGLKYMPRK